MQVDEGSENLQGSADKKEVSRSHSRPDPDLNVATGSGPSREIKRASSPLSVILIASKQESDSMSTLSPQLPCLIILLGGAGTPAVLDRVQQDPRPDENSELSATANEKKLSWKSIAFATAKLLLRGVRDFADAFGPLKSIAGGLCFTPENCEVWSDLPILSQV